MTVKTFGTRPGADYSTVEDTYIQFYSSAFNSAGTELRVGSIEEFNVQHAFFKWPSLATDLGTGITVSAANLNLCTSSTFSGSPIVGIYRLTTPNIIAEINWFQKQTAGPVLWANEGGLGSGDSNATLIASVSPTAAYQFVDVTSAGFAALIEGWANGTIPNYGCILAHVPDNALNGSTVGFRSSENEDEPTQRPLLTVTYTAGGGAVTLNVADAASQAASSGIPSSFVVTLGSALGASQTCSLALADITAHAGVDYSSSLTNSNFSNGVTISAGVLTIPSGVSSFTVTVPTL